MENFEAGVKLTFSALKTRVVARGQKNETNPIIWKRLVAKRLVWLQKVQSPLSNRVLHKIWI